MLLSVDCVEALPDVLPEAAPCVLVDDEELGLAAPDEELPGHGQSAGDDPPLAAGALELVPLEVVLPEVEPLTLDCEPLC